MENGELPRHVRLAETQMLVALWTHPAQMLMGEDVVRHSCGFLRHALLCGEDPVGLSWDHPGSAGQAASQKHAFLGSPIFTQTQLNLIGGLIFFFLMQAE